MPLANKSRIDTVDLTALPAFPEIVMHLLEACETPDSHLSDIAGLIRQDGVLASRVLSLTSSPAYGGRRTTRTLNLEQRLMLLGLNTVRTLALAAAVRQFIEKIHQGHTALLAKLWHQSLLTGEIAERLAVLSRYPHRHEAYLAGLISNLGQIALLDRAPEPYIALLERSKQSPINLPDAELETFGIDHAELGACLLERAGQGGPLVDAVRYHHADTDALTNAHHLVRLTAVATRMAETGSALADATHWIDAERLLGILPSLLKSEYAAAAEGAERSAQAFGVTPEQTAGLTAPSGEPPLNCAALEKSICYRQCAGS